MKLAMIDYGIGNLRSVKKALEAAGANVVQTEDPDLILAADKVVLPGVGAFRDGMTGLKTRGLVPILQTVVQRGTPLLGICVGMQLFFERGLEMGAWDGLGFIPGEVRPFPESDLKVPQTGWNQLNIQKYSPLLKGIMNGNHVYFNHSYYCAPADDSVAIALTDYGFPYASAVQSGNIYGVQFHPEKSQAVGLSILRNFVAVV
jgi:imidazole glycerol-phosphate synthase subunit HisH